MIQHSIDNPRRVMKTHFAQSVLETEKKGATSEGLRPMISLSRMKQAMEEGNVDAGIISCGEVVGLIHDIPSARDIIKGIVSEAKVIAQRLRNIGINL